MQVTRTKSFRILSGMTDSLSNMINEFLVSIEKESGFELVDIKHATSAYGTSGQVGVFMTALVIYKINI